MAKHARCARGRAARRLCRNRRSRLRHEQHRRGEARSRGPVRDRGVAEAKPSASLFKELESEIVRGNILKTGRRIDGRDTKTVRPIVGRGRRAAARPWLGAVHPRRDPGAGGGHARHRPGRADHRRARRRVPRGLHAALQLPALLGGRSGPHGLARAGARSAMASSPGARCARCCRARRSSPTRSASSRRSPSANGSSSMATVCGGFAVADGRGRAAGAPGRRHRHGPDQGRRRLRRPLRHPGRRGSSRRHGLQGRRHVGRRHLAADGHQDHLDHAGDHEDRARPGARRPPAHPGRDGQGASTGRARASARTRRASP